MNLYGYANGDPVNFSDPFGLTPVCIVAPGACLAAAAGAARGLAAAARSPAGQQAMARVRELGAAGERAVGRTLALAKNTTERLGTRIPDFADEAEGIVVEVKNVASQAFTRQLREMVQGADAAGKQFVLFVRSNTQLSGPLQDAVDAGQVIVRTIPNP